MVILRQFVSKRPEEPSVQNHQELIEQFSEHRSYLLRVARRKIKDNALAEDSVQSTLLAALVGIESFRRESSLRTWLLGILKHQILKAFEREGRFVRVDGFATFDSDDGAFPERQNRMDGLCEINDSVNPERVLMSHQHLRTVECAIATLTPGLQAIVQLHIVEGLDCEVVCQMLSISKTNFWVRLHRARERIKSQCSD